MLFLTVFIHWRKKLKTVGKDSYKNKDRVYSFAKDRVKPFIIEGLAYLTGTVLILIISYVAIGPSRDVEFQFEESFLLVELFAIPAFLIVFRINFQVMYDWIRKIYTEKEISVTKLKLYNEGRCDLFELLHLNGNLTRYVITVKSDSPFGGEELFMYLTSEEAEVLKKRIDEDSVFNVMYLKHAKVIVGNR